eukprot:TRINITY_DN2510_c0_g1_i3.p1 TRINITY_DN2510_c0_g1~~TRINITY_DN2510_c0_g1_i3.p1  ORF type:complete len:843 (+),score=357.36 TRINITY_DN2510_c0_g1_i3:194-2722(+)
MSSCSVRVMCRFRPQNAKEKKNNEKAVRSGFDIQYSGDTNVNLKIENTNHPFTFDRVFDPDTKQEEVYDVVAQPSVRDVLDGYNATIFAYGQTGSGKTFTMFGIRNDPNLRGLIPRASSYIFNAIEQDDSDIEYAIKISFLEIYKERIHDLLDPTGSKDGPGLKIRESPQKGIWVEGLSEEFATCEEDIEDLIKAGESLRATAATEMNERSSRSHSVLMVVIEQKLSDGSTKTGRLNLVDLAGSERVGKTNVTGKQLDEAKDINKSLSTLGKCIHALAEASSKPKGQVHIPFRESNLTRMLQESLGGNTKTTLFLAASPAIYNADETLSTLRFGASAKTIKTLVHINKKRSIAELEALVANLTKEVRGLQKYCKALEKHIEYMQSPDYDPSKPMALSVPRPTLDGKDDKKPAATPLTASGTTAAARPGSAAGKLTRNPDGSTVNLRRALNDSGEPSSDDDEDASTLSLAETQLKLQELTKASEMQLDMLRVELREAQEREKDFKTQLDKTNEKCNDAVEKLNSIRSKSAGDAQNATKRIAELEEQLREKAEESEESVLLLYTDNERLEQEVEELTARLHKLQAELSAKAPSPKAVINEDRVIELETQLKGATRKLRATEEREAQLNGKLQAQKERLAVLTQNVSELTVQNQLLKTEKDEASSDKDRMEKQVARLKKDIRDQEENFTKQVEELEKQVHTRSRVWRPARNRRVGWQQAFAEKVDILAHMKGLRKTNSPLLETAMKDHERSMISRGDAATNAAVMAQYPQLTQEELEIYGQAFAAVDTQKFYFIGGDQLRSIFQMLSRPISEENLVYLFTSLDQDQDGWISYDEYIYGMTVWKGQ